MADEIDVHFDARSGGLWLECGDAAFTRLRDELVATTGIGDRIEGSPDVVRSIAISTIRPKPSAHRLNDDFALVGCAVVGFVFLFLIIVGITTVVGWFG